MHFNRCALTLFLITGSSVPAANDQLAGLDAQVRALTAQEQYVTAIPLARTALGLAEQKSGQNDADIEHWLTVLADLNKRVGNITAAEPYLRRIVAIEDRTHGENPVAAAESFANLASVLFQLNQPTEAGDLRGRALSVYERLTGPADSRRARLAERLAQMEMSARHLPQAESLFRRAADIEEHNPPSPHLALYLAELGDVLTLEMERYDEALGLLRRALALNGQAPDADNPQLPVLTLTSLGDALTNTGDYAAAEQTLRRALALVERGQSRHAREGVLLGLAWLLNEVGRCRESDSTARQALALEDEAGQFRRPFNVFVAQVALVDALRCQNRISDAIIVARQALATVGQVYHPEVGVAQALGTLAALLYLDGKDAEAEQDERREIELFQAELGPEHLDLVLPLMDLGRHLLAAGRPTEAAPMLERAYRIATVAGAVPETWVAPNALMDLYGDPRVGHPALAIYFGKRAVNTLQTLRANLGASEAAAQAAYLQGVAPVYRRLAQLLIQQGRLGEAQQVLAMLKEQEFFTFTERGASSDPRRTSAELNDTEKGLAVADDELVRLKQRANDLQVKVTLGGQLTPAERAQLDQLNGQVQAAQGRFQGQADQVAGIAKRVEFLPSQDTDNIVTLSKEYGALCALFKKEGDHFSAANHARLDALRQQMDEATTAFEARAVAVANSSTDAEAQKLRKQEINDFSRAIQNTLRHMGHGAVVAQYVVNDDDVAILLTTPDVVLARETKIKRQDLTELITVFRKNYLQDPDQDPRTQAAVLYQLLLQPIAEDLRQAGAKTLMLDLHDILRYLPFATLYDGKHYLVEKMSIVMVTEAVRDKLGKSPNPNWSIWGLGITKGGREKQGGLDYDPLPYAGVELNAIAGPKGVLPGSVRLNADFNLSSLRDGLERSFPVIHIASHFQFTPGSMDNSFLLLGDGNRLTLSQIRDKLNFNGVELLTLSACETALGSEADPGHGVEVEGLGAIAQQAGASAVLATLWPVADESTAELMRALYQAHKDDHLDKADALRKAQLALLQGGVSADVGGHSKAGAAPFSHPFFWAPFILVGNWL